MATAQDMIAHSLHASRLMLHRFIDDLKPKEFLHQPCPGSNCAAWIIGHLARTAHRQLKFFGAANVPDLPAGFDDKFATTKAAAPTQANLGDPKELVQLFDDLHERLIAHARQMSDAALAGPPPFAAPLFTNAGEALNFMGLHVSMHMGQVSVIRRSLGYPPVA